MKFYIENYGCTMNRGEGEAISEALKELSFKEVERREEADLLILNSCVVIETTERKMLKILRQFKETGKPSIVTGCMADVFPEKIRDVHPSSFIVKTGKERQIKEILEKIEYLKREVGIKKESTKSASPLLPGKRKSPTFILPIAEGCLGKCSYCITRFARGRLFSYPLGELLSSFTEAVKNGAKEILLTSQDTGIYGRERGWSLPQLLTSLLEIEGKYFVRIGMMNPDSLKEIFEPFFEIFLSPAIYKFLHIPVQSGSNRILKLMRRSYTKEEYINLVEKGRERCQFTLSTDIIVGFPGESEEEFEESVKLIQRLKPDVVNITRFSDRPGTEASSLPAKVHGRITKERSRFLTELVNEIKMEKNERFVGDVCEVLVTKRGRKGTMLGRNAFYKPVVLHQKVKVGEFYKVEIKEAHQHYLVGKLL